jgi:hypothetical protein
MGAAVLVVVTWLLREVMPVTYPGSTLATRAIPLLVHLMVGTLAYGAGYMLAPSGRRDLSEVSSKLLRR